ncbi:hypothetical protein ACFY5C_39505 [Streptomyces sp. NPDC012935]|uniref:hypothetical protein n=1 Tax=Streptomyces sp. NPDC012935 TaxID=3364857 RepID=UPI00369EB7C9
MAALFILMFSTDGDKEIRRETLFGSLFFETQEKAGGVLGVEAGVANPTALIVLFFVLAVVLIFTQFIYRGLKNRREYLIKEISRG